MGRNTYGSCSKRYQCENLNDDTNLLMGFWDYGKYLIIYIVVASIVYNIIRKKMPQCKQISENKTKIIKY